MTPPAACCQDLNELIFACHYSERSINVTFIMLFIVAVLIKIRLIL